MGEQDHRQFLGGQDHAGDELDRELDAALANYSAVEPRAGLEERVLANLRAERTLVTHRAWWRWGLAVAAAVALVTIALAWRSGRTSQPVAGHPAIMRLRPTDNMTPVASHNGNALRPREHPPYRGAARQRSRPAGFVAANPKLEQFPSPRPLSEQEKILASYVAKDPDHAALIAEARMEVLRRDREEELREAGVDSRDSQPQ